MWARAEIARCAAAGSGGDGKHDAISAGRGEIVCYPGRDLRRVPICVRRVPGNGALIRVSRPIRVLVAKPGLDGHDARRESDRAEALRDAGMEVQFTLG